LPEYLKLIFSFDNPVIKIPQFIFFPKKLTLSAKRMEVFRLMEDLPADTVPLLPLLSRLSVLWLSASLGIGGSGGGTSGITSFGVLVFIDE